MCYYALDCFFDSGEFSLLTNLAILIRDTLSNVNSVIFWPLSSLLVNTVERVIHQYIAEDYLKYPQLSPSPEHFAFLKAIYECIDALVLRCAPCSLLSPSVLYMQIPIPEDLLQQLIYPMNLLHDLSRRTSPMHNSLFALSPSDRQPACMELISLSLHALDLYCSAGRVCAPRPSQTTSRCTRLGATSWTRCARCSACPTR